MIIGITGTNGTGKGEKVRETFARPFLKILKRSEQDLEKVYSAGTAPVPERGLYTHVTSVRS